MVEKFLHTFFLAVFECSVANLVHEEQNSLIPVPQVLLHQYPHPELQHCCDTNAARLGALHNMTLENRRAHMEKKKSSNQLFCLECVTAAFVCFI